MKKKFRFSVSFFYILLHLEFCKWHPPFWTRQVVHLTWWWLAQFDPSLKDTDEKVNREAGLSIIPQPLISGLRSLPFNKNCSSYHWTKNSSRMWCQSSGKVSSRPLIPHEFQLWQLWRCQMAIVLANVWYAQLQLRYAWTVDLRTPARIIWPSVPRFCGRQPKW